MSAVARLKLYVDRMSQPSRAILIFCKANGIDFEEVRIDISKRQHKSPQFIGLFTFARYPADLSRRARLHSVLDWHHSNLRRGAVSFVLNSALAPALGLPLNPEEAEKAEVILGSSLSKIESFWLDGEGKFLLGSSQPSIADLSLVCEIMQLEVVDDITRERILGPYSQVRKWIQDVKVATNPHFEEVHEILYKVKARLQDKHSKL